MSLVANRLKAAALKAQQNTQSEQKAVQAKVIGVDLAKGLDQSVSQLTSASAERPYNMMQFDMLKVAMDADLGQLKTFSDIEVKATYKSDALKVNEYLTYLETYRKSGSNHPNSILAWVFIWLVDLKRWDQALEWLPLLIEQQQPLPTRFKRKHWGELVIDEIYDLGLSNLENELLTQEQLRQTLSYFNAVISIFDKGNWQINQVCQGKLFALAGKLEEKNLNLGNALFNYLKAQRLNDKAGVKGNARNLSEKLGVEIDI